MGFSAFQGATLCGNFTLPNSIKRIGDFAFYECNLNESFILPKNLEEIGRLAFSNVRVYFTQIPDSVKVIKSSAFFESILPLNFTIPKNTVIEGGHLKMQNMKMEFHLKRRNFSTFDKLSFYFLINFIYSF